MILRSYKQEDINEIYQLFLDTVRIINSKDYTEKEIKEWAREDINLEGWNQRFLSTNTLVVEDNIKIVGYGNMSKDGYVDHLYVSSAHQKEGIASLILQNLEDENKRYYNTKSFSVDASITSKSFFIKKGYQVIKENHNQRNNQTLINFTMIK